MKGKRLRKIKMERRAKGVTGGRKQRGRQEAVREGCQKRECQRDS